MATHQQSKKTYRKIPYILQVTPKCREYRKSLTVSPRNSCRTSQTYWKSLTVSPRNSCRTSQTYWKSLTVSPRNSCRTSQTGRPQPQLCVDSIHHAPHLALLPHLGPHPTQTTHPPPTQPAHSLFPLRPHSLPLLSPHTLRPLHRPLNPVTLHLLIGHTLHWPTAPYSPPPLSNYWPTTLYPPNQQASYYFCNPHAPQTHHLPPAYPQHNQRSSTPTVKSL